jgi:hypothetical protein
MGVSRDFSLKQYVSSYLGVLSFVQLLLAIKLSKIFLFGLDANDRTCWLLGSEDILYFFKKSNVFEMCEF